MYEPRKRISALDVRAILLFATDWWDICRLNHAYFFALPYPTHPSKLPKCSSVANKAADEEDVNVDVTIPDAKATSKAQEEIGFAHRSQSEIDCTASRFLTGAAFSAVTFVFCVLFRVIIDDHRDYFLSVGHMPWSSNVFFWPVSRSSAWKILIPVNIMHHTWKFEPICVVGMREKRWDMHL